MERSHGYRRVLVESVDCNGDFNMILHPSARSGTRLHIGYMSEFRNMVDELMLVDLPLIGGQVTWMNSNVSASLSRIDHPLVS